MTLQEVYAVADGYDECARQLEMAALAIENSRQGTVTEHLNDLIELSFALVRAGHIEEQQGMEPVRHAIAERSLLRVAVDYPRFRFLTGSEGLAPHESLVTIDPTIWSIEISDPLLDAAIVTVDTGWRDVTADAREDDPDVDQAFLRRVDTNVRYLQHGGDLSALAREHRRDLLAERCFGMPRPEFPWPTFVSSYEGFTPERGRAAHD